MHSHRELRAWQMARSTSLAVFRQFDRSWTPSRAAAIEQLRRAALSVQLNIAEGYASGTTRRFVAHLRIAYGSAVESTDILELLVDLGCEVEEILALSRRTQALTLRLMKRMQAKLNE